MAKQLLGAAVWIVALAASGAAFAQTPTGASGHWEGAIQVPGQELKIEVDLAAVGEKWEGTITIPVQGLKSFPLAAVTVQGDAVSFAMKGVPGDPTFKGTLSKDAVALAGDFSQGGGSVPFSLARTGEAKIERPPASTAITTDLEGAWEGALDVDGKTLRLVLKLSNGSDGVGTGMLVSVDQGGAEVPIAAVVQTGAHLKLLVPVVVGTYDGDLEGAQLKGTWTQGPRTWPLVFTRAK